MSDNTIERLQREKDALHELFGKLTDAKKITHVPRDEAAIVVVNGEGWVVPRQVDAELTTLRAQVAGLDERVRLLTTAIEQVGIIPKGTPERMKAAGLEYDAKFVERALIDCERAYAASAVKEPA